MLSRLFHLSGVMLNPLKFKSDQKQCSPDNINMRSRKNVMRSNQMIS